MNDSRWTRRDFVKRSAMAGAAVVGAPAFLAACSKTGGGQSSQNALQSAKDAGTIKVGIAGEAPYGFQDKSGKVTGESPEVARAVFKNLGIPKISGTLTDFDGLIPGLNANHYDVVCAGMAILPERCANAAFSVPDYQTLTAFLVPKGNPKNIKTFDDIAKDSSVKLAVLGGAVERSFAKGAGVPDDQITVFDNQSALLQAVTSGRAYCSALTDISLRYLAKTNPDAKVEVTPGIAPTVDGKKQVQYGGFVFRKGNNQLRDAFNTQLKKLHDSGKWVEIVKPFGFTKDNLPSPDVTTEQLCSG